MQRIVSPDGLFHDGNPATGLIGTFLAAIWHNAVQEEIIAPITAAGLTLDPTNNGQLLAAILALIESKTGNYGLDTGAANSYVTALTPAVIAYANGLQVRFRAAHANTGQSTLNAGAGVVPLLRDDGTALQAGDVPANVIVGATYDSTLNAFLLNSIVASQFDTIMQSGAPLYSVDTGAANVYKAAYAPTISAITDGMKLRFRAKTANTGASTFAPDGMPAAPILGGDHAVLAGGEIVVNGEIEVQWNAALNSGNGAWLLCENTGGYQRGTTPPQFDNSGRLATTAAVLRQGLQFGANNLIQGATVLTAANAGQLIQCSGTGPYPVTLPSIATMPSGACLYLFATTGPITVTRAGTDPFYGTTATSFVLNAGDTLILESSGSTAWNPVGGTAQLGISAAFASLLSANGFQKLPGGFIVQWGSLGITSAGTAAVFPMAFPNAVYGVAFGQFGTAIPANCYTALNGAPSLTGFTVSASGATPQIFYIAIGK